VEYEIRLRRVRAEPFSEDAIAKHVDRLAHLDDAGQLIAAGPLADGAGGVILARFGDLAEAQRFAQADPYVTGGWETAEVRPWQWAHRANHYLDPALPGRRAPVPRRFVPLPLDKHDWGRSPLPGQIVLVTTVDRDGAVDVAPKSWVSMAAFDPPVIGFGCNTAHLTHDNAAATGEFVINVVPASLAPATWAMLADRGGERLEHARLRLGRASAVAAPVILDCVAHLECQLEQIVTFGHGEVFIFGRVVAVAIDEECLTGDAAVAYRRLDPCFFLQAGLYAGLGSPASSAG
jgi:flavin reductase (DIM6/NTAB) family NADH-FMN oxidoreductase RutF/uncharacterized protein YciI